MTLSFKTMPLGTNNLYVNGKHGRFMAPKARENKQALQWEARSQFRGKTLPGPLAVEITLFWGDRRKRDIDNIKILLDSLTGIVWDDDSQIEDLHTMKAIDKDNPRVEMRVFEL